MVVELNLFLIPNFGFYPRRVLVCFLLFLKNIWDGTSLKDISSSYVEKLKVGSQSILG